ncbi:MAG: indolepyruvate ferredoxin oxidoreductase subunit alpha [Treponema sp.]|jgi:indolepyruvate ferredoxin oxidoreductase alpha subunit|nr:indolepyruvate ferredoxin oxidoreductase subunit alpha [Treponema sp.]
MTTPALLGDEAVALGALHAGVSAAYGYPGTPSTEILEYLIAEYDRARNAGTGGPVARWCTNEKTALEAGLGVSFSGRRAIITMKHVGLNVAADPFVNGALLGIKGGLVIVAADDPGMHSSQNEQDSRFYAAFALVPCLEPRHQQEAYDMTREAFELSEKFHIPVLLRLSTRLSHARAAVVPAPPRSPNPLGRTTDTSQWMLLPAHARRNYAALIEKQGALNEWSAGHRANKLELPAGGTGEDLAVITAGLGGNYYEENFDDFVRRRDGKAPPRLHIGAYPLPVESIRRLCAGAKQVLVIEEGQPFIEERLRGILPPAIQVSGKLDGAVNRTGELDPDKVRKSLGLPPRPGVLDSGSLKLPPLPGRPPQLCAGCPHGDSYETINRAVAELDPAPGHPSAAVLSDIGCYSLGAAPPYSAIESIVCMGASVGMAKGAADSGIPYAVAVIGDSTFLHSGITGLIDAAAANTPMTLIILDNSIVAMTGCQETMIPSAKLPALILGAGVPPEHLLELEAKKQLVEENTARLKQEMEYRGLSVVIFRRECLEAFRKRRKKTPQ